MTYNNLGKFFYKSVKETLSLAQEGLISNRNQIGNQNKLIRELKTARTSLEQDSAKKEEQLKEQQKPLQDVQKEKVFYFLTRSRIFRVTMAIEIIQSNLLTSKGITLYSTAKMGIKVINKRLLVTVILILGGYSLQLPCHFLLLFLVIQRSLFFYIIDPWLFKKRYYSSSIISHITCYPLDIEIRYERSRNN